MFHSEFPSMLHPDDLHQTFLLSIISPFPLGLFLFLFFWEGRTPEEWTSKGKKARDGVGAIWSSATAHLKMVIFKGLHLSQALVTTEGTW